MTDVVEDHAPRPAWKIPSWYRRTGIVSWFFIGICAAIALLAWLIAATSEIMMPLVLGGFFAIVFVPAVGWLEERRVPRAAGALIVLIGLAVVIGAVVWVCVAAIVDQADELTANIDRALADIRSWFENTPVNEELADQVRDTTASVGPALSEGLAGRAVSLLDSAWGFVTGLILGTIVLYYLLKDGPAIADSQLEREDDEDRRALLQRISGQTTSNVRNYFRGRTAMALVNGGAIGLAAAVLGVPAAGAIAVVNVIGAYVPYLGAFVGGAFAVLMALGEGGLALALVILVITLAVNLLLENLLEPVLIGDSMNMHPLLILLATTLGGLIAGMIGLILAAPFLAIVLDTTRELKAAGFFDED